MRRNSFAASELERLAAQNWPQLATASGIVWRLQRAVERVRRALHPAIAVHGIQAGDFEVLIILRLFGAPFELSPTTIYRARLCSSGGLTKVLHRLERARLIARRPDAEDRRSELVRLTPKGKRVVEAAMATATRMEKELLAPFRATERRMLASLLDKLLARTEVD